MKIVRAIYMRQIKSLKKWKVRMRKKIILNMLFIKSMTQAVLASQTYSTYRRLIVFITIIRFHIFMTSRSFAKSEVSIVWDPKWKGGLLYWYLYDIDANVINAQILLRTCFRAYSLVSLPLSVFLVNRPWIIPSTL